jgi:hypothetical protein
VGIGKLRRSSRARVDGATDASPTVPSFVEAGIPTRHGDLPHSGSPCQFPFSNCLKTCSKRVGFTPLKPRCRNNFDPGVFSCADGEPSTKSHQYPKSSQQLALSDVLCRLPLSKNRDTAKRRSRVDSVPKNALCLSKTQRHSPRVKTLVGFTVNSWNSNSTSGVMRPWGYGPKIEGRCSWQSGSLERTTARSKINHIVVEFKREGMIHPYSRRRLGWQSLQIDCCCLPASK